MNGQFYCEMMNVAELTFPRKKKTKSVGSVILLHDNVRPHVDNATTQKLGSFGWETVKNSPYSLNLPPYDFHLFVPLRKRLKENDLMMMRQWSRLYASSVKNKLMKTGF